MSKKQIFPLIIILALFVIAAYFYPRVPEQVPVHWNTAGEADDYGSRAMGLLFLPLITLAIYLLFLLIPKIAVFKFLALTSKAV